MKLIGRTLAVLAAALIVVGFWLAIGALGGSAASAVGEMGRHGAESSGFNLAAIAQLIPALAAVAIVTAIVAPIKRRLLSKRRPSAPARRPNAANPAA